jgi:choice-of-anchor A domain-containing protein
VTFGGTSNVAGNFTVNGGLAPAPPPFSFADQFISLKNESSTLAASAQSAGATVVTSYGQLQLTGTAPGLNVFTVTAAQLAQAQGIVINLTQPGATALINVTTDTQLSIGPQYMNLTGTAIPADVLWNFPLATGLAVTAGVAWQGSILAPNAKVTTAGHPRLHGQLIAATVPSSDWLVDRVTFTGCLAEPPTPPDNTLTLTPLCIDSAGNLDMRLRNTGTTSRAVVWNDMMGGDFGQFVVPAEFRSRPGRHTPQGDEHELVLVVQDLDRRATSSSSCAAETRQNASNSETWALAPSVSRFCPAGAFPSVANWPVKRRRSVGGDRHRSSRRCRLRRPTRCPAPD